MKEITATMVHDLLRKAVELKGSDYVYPTYRGSALNCYYAKDGQPDCIVGHVLFDLGVPIADMTWDDSGERRGDMATDVISVHRDYLLEEHGLKFDDVAWEMLRSAQSKQDWRCSWGEALEAASGVMTARLKSE